MKIILSPNPYRDRGLKTAQAAARILKEAGVETRFCLPFEPDPRFELPKPLTYAEINQEIPTADLLICFGGDGTLLHAAKVAYSYDVPIMGVNMGSVGFMAELEHSELQQLSRLAKGDYTIERRMMLTAKVYRDGACIADVNALNDMVVTKGALSRIIKLELLLDNQLVERYHGDGLIFSTPTGSTGYSLSAGGPVVHPAIDLCIVAPICPHSLIARPLIFSPEHTLTVRLDANNAPAMLTVDGQNGVELKKGDMIQISKAEHDTGLIVLEKRNFFAVLREKLKGVQD